MARVESGFVELVQEPVVFPVVASGGGGAVALSWDVVPGAVRYRVYCGLTADALLEIGDTPDPAYALSGLSATLSSFVQVLAVPAHGRSIASEVMQVMSTTVPSSDGCSQTQTVVGPTYDHYDSTASLNLDWSQPCCAWQATIDTAQLIDNDFQSISISNLNVSDSLVQQRWLFIYFPSGTGNAFGGVLSVFGDGRSIISIPVLVPGSVLAVRLVSLPSPVSRVTYFPSVIQDVSSAPTPAQAAFLAANYDGLDAVTAAVDGSGNFDAIVLAYSANIYGMNISYNDGMPENPQAGTLLINVVDTDSAIPGDVRDVVLNLSDAQVAMVQDLQVRSNNQTFDGLSLNFSTPNKVHYRIYFGGAGIHAVVPVIPA
jgi:hypothetical protein